jgi:carbamoylphosphate synthase small subunit
MPSSAFSSGMLTSPPFTLSHQIIKDTYDLIGIYEVENEEYEEHQEAQMCELGVIVL